MSQQPTGQTPYNEPKACLTVEADELINDFSQALEELVKIWKAIDTIAPKRRYGHLVERHQALIDRAHRLAPRVRGEREG